VRGSQRAHGARAQDGGPHAGQIPGEHLGGGRERLGHDRRARGVDPGARVHPLADVQCLLRQLVQGAPDCAGRVRRSVGRPELAEDLRLADHHRLQSGRDGEKVLHRRARVVHVEVPGEFGQRQLGVPAKHGGDVRETAVEGVDDRVDLNAVAGRQHHHLGDVAAVQHLVEQLWNFAGRDGHPLEQLDRRTAVRQAHHEHVHGDHLPLFAGVDERSLTAAGVAGRAEISRPWPRVGQALLMSNWSWRYLF
jgi:hypothetical protein